MADPVVIYPFDPTGQASTNRVTAEEIIVLPPGDRLFHYTMPKLAPFFQAGLTVKLRDMNNNIIPLTLGVDYYLGHKFMDASLATMHPIFGSISFLRRDIAGTILMDYQHLGGIWTISASVLAEILLNKVRNPRTTAWEQVVERPVDFPVIDHVWNLDDMVGQKEILDVMERFYEAYIISLDPEGSTGSGAILAHLQNMQNPHQTTAAQVGAYSMVQTDTKLGLYLPKDSQAVDSLKLGGLTIEDLEARLAQTKITNASHADTATNADRASASNDSDRLNGQSLLEILQTVAASTVANASRLSNLTVSQLTTNILAGKANDSAHLEGKTLNDIITLLQQSTGDASTLQGKSLEALMNDVINTEVKLATRATMAADSEMLGGKSLNLILSEVASVTPETSKNAERVYGYLFPDLVQNIMESATYLTELNYRSYLVEVAKVPIISTNDGGIQDPGYSYLRAGIFPIPTMFALNGDTVWDESTVQVGSVLELAFYYQERIHNVFLNLSIKASREVVIQYFCDTDIGLELSIGADNSMSEIKNEAQTAAALNAEVWLKYRVVDKLDSVGVWMPVRNYFVPEDPDVPLVYDHTCANLNQITWTAVSYPEPLVEGLDALADEIDQLIQQPAA